jgi:hypothetical protein
MTLRIFVLYYKYLQKKVIFIVSVDKHHISSDMAAVLLLNN